MVIISGRPDYLQGIIKMAWIYLFFAGLLEVVWAYYMKQSSGFTKLVPSIITLITMALSFILLSISMRSLSLGTAYAIWTGIGTVGAFILGVVLLGEPANMARIAAALLIIGGLILMKLSG